MKNTMIGTTSILTILRIYLKLFKKDNTQTSTEKETSSVEDNSSHEETSLGEIIQMQETSEKTKKRKRLENPDSKINKILNLANNPVIYKS